MVPQVELLSFVFFGELKKPKRHFEINWPLEAPLAPQGGRGLKNQQLGLYIMAGQLSSHYEEHILKLHNFVDFHFSHLHAQYGQKCDY